MEFTGKIIAILSPRGGVSKTSGNEWKSQEYVIENHDQYPRKMCFDVFGADKIEQFNIQMGEELTVSFDVDLPLLRNLLRVMPRTICLSKPKVFRLTIQIKKLPVRMILAGSFFIPALCKDSSVG